MFRANAERIAFMIVASVDPHRKWGARRHTAVTHGTGSSKKVAKSHVVGMQLSLRRVGVARELRPAAMLPAAVRRRHLEELITALSQLRWLFVIDRQSSFTCKSQPWT
jgi:hypothetical protein